MPTDREPGAFYLARGQDRYRPTKHTAGPWDPNAQHFGPPSALLVRALEDLPTDRERQLARVTVEILGPAPLAELTVRARVERPGRSVELLAAELAADGRTVARATAWRITASDTAAVAAGAAEPIPLPADSTAAWPPGFHGGYIDAMEWRVVAGGLDRPGPATVWVRQRVALVEGERPTSLQRLFAMADSGSGVSNRLDPRQWLFINSELTVHLHRLPSGSWTGMEADTIIGPSGLGTASTRLYDASGQIGTGAQALLVRTR
ncbi:thioesterase family protein [Amycolatopsis cihanbeyliensis]|uniref:Thioesterase superfamily protein n=1 Tax=Amycolatopsis cihanbeyliensis TaxID=1128664 RepID=A0A542DCF2_AMYCI|nr:thioesterase family protein [Amycolatopsis cihanbeyliensis]TQJ00750.1 thioesterase superfamily protein [Amycolatopsis cihanbeyliensis]